MIITELGYKVSYEDKVYFHNDLIRPEKKTYILLNKPKNCVTTSDDPQERLTVLDLVKSATNDRVYPVGRLDRNTTGVLLLTNDGDLASKLTHPKYNKKKIYHVGLDKALTREHFDKIKAGLVLEDGLIEVDELHYLEDMNDELGVEIHSGRNRIVRRIFESLVNVSYEIKDEKTRKRELDGLLEAMEYFHQDAAYLITKDEDSVVEMDGKKVYIVPLYKYLIEGG